MQKISYATAIIGFFLMGVLVWHSFGNAQSSTVTTTVQITVCGNGVQESGEECDGSDLAGATCSNQGFTGGDISCNSSCEVDTSSCTAGGGTVGGGGFGSSRDTTQSQTIPQTAVTFTG